jgi:hypothetical protein
MASKPDHGDAHPSRPVLTQNAIFTADDEARR